MKHGTLSRRNGSTSNVVRVHLENSSVTTGAGLTGLDHTSTGLIISTIADNEAAPTNYTVAGTTLETITTLGTFAAPTATKARFKAVDGTNQPGVYELHIADARFAVSAAKSLKILIHGATNLKPYDLTVDLAADALANVTRWNSTAVPSEDTAGYPKVTIKDGTGTGEIDTASGKLRLASDGLDTALAETGINIRQAIALILSKLCGKRSGMATATNTYKGADNTTSRIVETTDSDGNCTATTLTPPA